MKKIISLFLSIVLLFGIGAETFAAVSETPAETYVTVDCTDKVDISYEIIEQQSNSFTAEISIKNKSDEPISGWQLSFKGNFGISSIQNANNLSSKNEFRIESNASDQPIAKGETKKFEFRGVIAPGETPVLSDFVLMSVVSNSNDEQVHMILCFGGYIEGEKSLEIYWYSTDEGEVSLYENTDDGGWDKLAELTDEKSYKHKIGEDFLEKQIKAVQETADGTLESDPFIVARKNGEIVCEWLDSDDDGLADFAEKTLGTDPENPDTDGDGLTDYEELYITGTDPLKSDTNGNGVNDADDDLDGDGLSNKKEISLGTSPISADTDEDGLSDSDEINKHKTDPLKTDSDGDGLNDGEEIAIGLNPNKPETFGMPDSEYKVKQTISADSEAMSRVNTEESPYELSLEISATGNASTRLSANDSAYSAVTESDARLGGAVELRYLGEVDKVKLTYKIADEYIPNSSEISEKSLDFQGIKRYNIFRYFEEINMLLPVATEVDEESNTLFAETDELGTYCVLDMEVLMRNFGIEPEEIVTETVTRQMYSAAPAAVNDTSKSDKYFVTFIIDVRKGAFTSEQLSTILNEINKFVANSYLEQRDTTIRIVSQDATNFRTVKHITIGDYQTPNELFSGIINVGILAATSQDSLLGGVCVITDALSDAVENYDKSAQNFVFDIYNQQNAVFEQGVADELCKNAKKNGVNISIISRSSNKLAGFQKQLIDYTDGIEHTKSFDFVKEVYEHVYKEEYVPKELMLVFLSTGFQYVVLDSKLYPDGKNPNRKNSDTDKDGITDWNEVRNDLLKRDSDGNYTLPTIGDCINSLGNVPFYVENAFKAAGELEDYVKADVFSQILDFQILPIKSDPTSADGDEDGIDDAEEKKLGTSPLNCDTDGDGLWDGDECYIGTNPLFVDTDGDGLSDGFEVELWFDPLNPNPDGDKYDDYQECRNGTNPYVYDYTKAEEYEEFLKGVGLGAWNGTADNIPQLLGQIAGSFVPFVADARDYFANVFKNRDTFAALLNLGGFLADLATCGADIATDAAKAAPKLGMFISKNPDDASKITEAITQTSKQLSKDDGALSPLVKNFDAKTISNIEKSLKSTKNITRANYSKLLGILETAGKNVDSSKSILSTLNSVDAMRVTGLVNKYGNNVTSIISAGGYKNIRLTTKVIELYGKNTDKLAVVSKGVSLCGDDSVTLNGLLKTLTNHSETMIKALGRCDSIKGVKDYVELVNYFGDNANNIIDRYQAKSFEGLKEALDLKGDAISFVQSKDDPGVYKVITNKVYVNNPTISVPDSMKAELKEIDEMTLGSLEKGKRYTQFYSNLLTRDYSARNVDSRYQEDYNKLVDAVADARKHFASKMPNTNKTIGVSCEFYTGITGEHSAVNNRSVINCAEIWNAREAILNGTKFEDIDLTTYHLKPGESKDEGKYDIGDVFKPCKNCQVTFKQILGKLGG